MPAVDLAKRLEGDFDLRSSHSRSGIPDFEREAAILGAVDREGDRAAGSVNLNRVRQQVEQDLRQPG